MVVRAFGGEARGWKKNLFQEGVGDSFQRPPRVLKTASFIRHTPEGTRSDAVYRAEETRCPI